MARLMRARVILSRLWCNRCNCLLSGFSVFVQQLHFSSPGRLVKEGKKEGRGVMCQPSLSCLFPFRLPSLPFFSPQANYRMNTPPPPPHPISPRLAFTAPQPWHSHAIITAAFLSRPVSFARSLLSLCATSPVPLNRLIQISYGAFVNI